MSELPKHYDPAVVENKWYEWWMEKGLFHGDSREGGEPYCIVIPPPNVTGILHMGHALNNTIQDILVRWHKMQGRNVVWVPGTDHAGIATQNVVERHLKKEGKTRDDLGREAFIDRVWEWREEYGGTIINQLKKLGAACDWERERFTMDEGLSDAVEEVFIRLYEKGLIYKGNYIINWCPRCHTALSDEESEHQDTQGRLYYLKYPLKDSSSFITVATTRPETMLGDVAVAVNPEDPRYSEWVGQSLVLPVLQREIPVVADEFVDPAFGTGAVKVTPAHDPNDFEIGLRHELEPINVMHHDGTMNEMSGPYQGMDRFDCRKKLMADLEEQGLVEKTEEHSHAVGHCYRCDTIVEPRLSPQWFVRMKPLAEPAIEAVKDGRIRFVPDRWTNTYMQWMENIRDWCISRQIWWGHRIPVFYCKACGHEWAVKGRPASCAACGSDELYQDKDVLDTWFSSWLWPFSVYGWPNQNEDLHFYYPTQTLVTASEIIFFWVARMIMSGIEFMGDIPFSEVYIHGTVRDEQGRKMSKSLGNSIDPLTIIDQYSADALRFSLMMITATGQDVFLSDDKFEIGRNFGTKIWNAARFMQMHSAQYRGDVSKPALDAALLTPDDKHLLATMNKAAEECGQHLERFRFNDAAQVLYEFTWHQYCDWYIEYAKHALNGDEAQRRDQVLEIMHYVFSNILRLLHPFMPFLTEELWHGLGYTGLSESIMTAPWPADCADQLRQWGVTDEDVHYVESKHELIRTARTLMADYSIVPKFNITFIIKPDDLELKDRLEEDMPSVVALIRAERLDIKPSYEPDRAMPSAVCSMGSVFMPVEGVIDVEEELTRLEGQASKLKEELGRIVKKLSNEQYIKKAPAEVVEGTRLRHESLKEELRRLAGLTAALRDSASG